MAKGDIALLLGGKPEESEESEGPEAGEMAVKAFFKAGASGDWKKALSALKTAIGDDDDEDAEPVADTDDDGE